MNRGRHWIQNPLRKLWVKMAVGYMLISIVSELILLGIMDVTINYQNLKKATEPNRMLLEVQSKAATLTKISSLGIAANEIASQLLDLGMPLNTSEYYRIRTSSRPLASVVFIDQDQKIVAGSDDYARLSSGASPRSGTAVYAKRINSDTVEIQFPIIVEEHKLILVCRLQAAFDPLLQLRNSFSWLWDAFEMFVLFSAIMGLAGGALAARLITRRLKHMTVVSSAWSKGDWDARIIDSKSDELSDHAAHLNHMARQLKDLVGLRLVDAIKDERARMAGELHDRVKQKLFALSLQLAATLGKINDPAIAAQHLREARTILAESQGELVGVINELRLQVPEDLSKMIEQFCLDGAKRAGIALNYKLSDSRLLDGKEKNVLFQIILESVQNAFKHASPSKIDISLTVTQKVNELSIDDDGRGFDANSSAEGIGLSLMRERAGALPNSKLVIESKPACGTKIVLTWEGKNP